MFKEKKEPTKQKNKPKKTPKNPKETPNTSCDESIFHSIHNQLQKSKNFHIL